MRVITSSIIVLFLTLITLIQCEVSGPNSGPDIYAQLTAGSIKGRMLRTANNNSGYVFQGIPYAQPPIDDLRYQMPTPMNKWAGVQDCTAYRDACMSNTSSTSSPQSVISEDCLHVNVFAGTNCKAEGNSCPVVYYIHGGGHNFDSPRMFPPDVLVDNFAAHGLVFVTVGYRLGSFGFFNTATREAMGNWGMYDIVEGLKWVQREISAFGGNPKNVTIMGHSSGAGDVSLLSLSPQLNGRYFSQGIAMSGQMVSPMNRLANDSELCRLLAVKAGCTTMEEWNSGAKFAKTLACLKNRSGHDLLMIQRSLEDNEGLSFQGPRIDGPNGLFPSFPWQLAQSRYPYRYMTGTTKNEYGSFSEAQYENVSAATMETACTQWAKTYGFSRFKLIGKACTKAYNSTGLSYSEQIKNLVEDLAIFVSTFEDARTVEKTGEKVYLYSFDYVKRGLEGVAPWHSMDLTYVMGVHPFEYDDRDRQIQKLYPALFANFAKFGTPTPQETVVQAKWSPLSKEFHNYYSVDLPRMQNKLQYHYPGVNFWVHTAPLLETSGQTFDEDQNLPKAKKLLLMQDSNNTTDTVNSGTDWQTAFWITLCMAILICLTLVMFVVLKQCARSQNTGLKEEFSHPDPDDQKTAPLSPPTETSLLLPKNASFH